MKDIEVSYIDGFSKEEFEILKEIDGLEINIPENKNNISAVLSTPEDYILIFSLYFGSKVIEKLFDKVYEKIADKIISSITKIWNKAKEIKPCIIKSDCAPIYKT